MHPKILKLATRNSPLALWQTNHVCNLLKQHWPDVRCELLPMLTSGDKFLKDKLSTLGGSKGMFVKELEEALLDKRADLAVHSIKDMPVALPEGLMLSTICKRHSPFDALISPKFDRLETLPAGAVIGTSSLRRQSQLLAARSDLSMKTLRGNVQTRLKKLHDGEYDAIVLAVAGLERLEMQNIISEIFSTEIMLPACGQGAIGIECRSDDEKTQTLLAPLNDPTTAICVNIERQVNALLGGNCHVPLAVYCEQLEDSQLLLRAKIASMDGKIIISNRQKGFSQNAITLANTCAETMLANGANELLAIHHESN